MQAPDTNVAIEDAETLALQALVWTLASGDRPERLLSLTGLDSDELRARATDPALLAAVIDFLSGHEPDLEACAAELGVRPDRLIAAGRALAQRANAL